MESYCLFEPLGDKRWSDEENDLSIFVGRQVLFRWLCNLFERRGGIQMKDGLDKFKWGYVQLVVEQPDMEPAYEIVGRYRLVMVVDDAVSPN